MALEETHNAISQKWSVVFSSHFEGQMVFISSVVTWVSWVSTLKTSAESLIMSRISISSVQSSKLLFWLLKKGENMICFSMYLNERKTRLNTVQSSTATLHILLSAKFHISEYYLNSLILFFDKFKSHKFLTSLAHF